MPYVFNPFTGNLDYTASGGGGGSGTVTSVSVASSNGFAGTVANPTTNATITLTTTVTGLLKGNGTTVSAATVGTDYSVGTSALTTGILKSTTTTGALTIAVAGDFPTLNQSTTGNAATATNIAGGANGSIPYQTASNTTTFLAAGSNTNVLTLASGVPTWAAPASSGTVTSVSVASANGFAGTVANATSTPAITVSTTVTGILYGNGTSVATAIAGNFPTLNQNTTGNASTSTTATNIAGGAGGSIPYQTAANTTSLLANGTSGYLLQANGTTLAPTWVPAPTGFTNPMTTLGDVIYGGASGVGTRLAGNTTTTREFLTSVGSAGAALAPTFSALVSGDIPNNAANTSGNALTATTATTATNATNVATTATNSSSSTFFPIFVASSTGSNQGADTSTGLTWVPSTGTLTATVFSGSLSGNATTATSATIATNLGGGAGGTIPYQTSANVTAMLSNGTAGYLLQSNGTTLAPTWVVAPSGFANPMTTLGDIIYGGAAGAPTRLPVGTNGTVLTVVSGSPAWSSAPAPAQNANLGFNYAMSARMFLP
jgi:hypothetical protein